MEINLLDVFQNRLFGMKNTDSVQKTTEQLLRDMITADCEICSKINPNMDSVEITIKFQNYEQYIQFLLENDL